ncbi:MAG: methyltransferase domain-containing protein [Candidatus Paceibacterota bacterium]|nr:MAG: methyltransferase domain-containing protein [Candidatus Paceibacterota bacterium]
MSEHAQRPFLDTSASLKDVGVREGMRVADFGCGTGFYTIQLGQRVGSRGEVVAIDVQNPPLESVRTRAQAAGLENIRTVRADLEVPKSTGIPDGALDMVTIANVLFQSQKKENILQEAHRVLKLDGRLVVIEWAKGAGGMGPVDDMRTSVDDMRTIVQKEGFVFERNADAGAFHYILIFKKTS